MVLYVKEEDVYKISKKNKVWNPHTLQLKCLVQKKKISLISQTHCFPLTKSLEVGWLQHGLTQQFNNVLKDLRFFSLFVLPSPNGLSLFPSLLCPHGCKLAAAAPLVFPSISVQKGSQEGISSLPLYLRTKYTFPKVIR